MRDYGHGAAESSLPGWIANDVAAALATQPATSQEGEDAMGAAMRNHCLRYGQGETLPPHEMADMLGWLMARAGLRAPGPIAATSSPPTETPKQEGGLYLIRKNGMFYRPNAQGYTCDPAYAGRFTLSDAIRHSYPNGLDGPRDGIDYMFADEPDAPEHGLADPVAWEPEAGSVAALARAKAGAGGA